MSCTTAFINYLVDQTPHFDADIVRGINPTSGTWIGKVATRTWPSYAGNQHYFDRFTNVFPNPTREWTAKEYAACTGTPCDPDADQIGWGNIRQYYFKEERHIETPLVCFDQIRDVSHAKEHVAQIISQILRPATRTIMDYYLKKRSAQHAGTRWVASTTMPTFNYVWMNGSGTNADNEIYIETDIAPTDICKLGPQMLQRRVTPLTLEGYMDEQVFESFPRLIELITDIETVWDLDKQQTAGGTLNLAGQWRYSDWATVNEFWRYGFTGQLGNYAVSADPFPLRFIYLDARGSKYTYRYQLVLPYKNVDASTAAVYEGASFVSGTGKRMVRNDDFDKATYQFSFIHNRKAGIVYVADAEPVNPEMPFGSRNLAGEWKFANEELGCENIRKNKGKFYADFELAFKPERPELEELIFHRREPACVVCVDVCDDNEQTAYPTQYYNSDNPLCDEGPWTTSETCSEGQGVQVTTVEISGVTVALDAASKACVADHAAIAVLLNADSAASLMGTWDTNDDGNLILDNPTVVGVNVVIDCCSL